MQRRFRRRGEVQQKPLGGNLSSDRCLVCGAHSFRDLFQRSDNLLSKAPRAYSVRECADCGLIQLHPRPTELEIREFHSGYERWERQPNFPLCFLNSLRRHLSRSDLRFIERSMHPSDSVLELSWPGSWITDAMSERGIGVSTCAHLHVIPPTHSQLPPIRFAPGSFGAIVAWHVLDHVSDPRLVLLFLREILSQGGTLVLKIANGDSWPALILGDRWAGFDIPRNPFLFQSKHIEGLLQDCGYTVVRSSCSSGFEDAVSLASSLCPRLDPGIRSMRGTGERRCAAVARDLLYGALTAAMLPFTLLEAASGSGTSIILEARKAGEEGRGESGF